MCAEMYLQKDVIYQIIVNIDTCFNWVVQMHKLNER